MINCKPTIVKTKFDDIREGDMIILSIRSYSTGYITKYYCASVKEKYHTMLHKHEYIYVDGRKFYKCDNPYFHVLELKIKNAKEKSAQIN
jgi:hypothetical protein